MTSSTRLPRSMRPNAANTFMVGLLSRKVDSVASIRFPYHGQDILVKGINNTNHLPLPPPGVTAPAGFGVSYPAV